MQIRTLKPHEATLHRTIRLQALQESPNAFGETFPEAAMRPMVYWEDLTTSVTQPDSHVMFLACEGGIIQGCVYGLIDRQQTAVGRVGGMWVAPLFRRQGCGYALLQAVIGWARNKHFDRLGLWAPADSPAAVKLYSKAGFYLTGRSKPLPTNPALHLLEMECDLSALT